MTLKTFQRYEKKYVINISEFNLLLPEIKRHMSPDAYCTDGRRYSIYNIYFDNDTNDVIRNSVSKPYYKEKLRLRSYHPDPEPDDILFIEIKKKTGQTVCKRRAVMTCKDSAAFLDSYQYPDKYDYMQYQVLKEIEYFIRIYHAKPVVYMSYDRYAYFDDDNPEFRLTFDSNIQTRRNRLTFHGGTGGDALIRPDQYLMEIKTDGAIPLWLAHKMSEIHVFSTNFSKYGREYTAHHENTDISQENQKLQDIYHTAGF